MNDINLIATAAFGIESVVDRELSWLGYEDKYVENGRVYFKGDYDAICRTNIWLRCADRILINAGEFTAVTFDELFENTKAIPWENWIPADAEFPVEGKSVKSTLFSVPDCQAIVKKAIVERLKLKYGIVWFPETGAKYKIEVAILKDNVTLTIDTTGPGLNKRGYREAAGIAPLKETLACAMLNISRWKWDRVLIDPMCGSGTIPIEAAMIALNIAPGAKREFAAQGWNLIPKECWIRARQEAEDSVRKDADIRIQGSDISEKAVSLARYHADKAGVGDKIHFQKRDIKDISSKYKYGFVITNPPYGQRLEDEKAIKSLYRDMGKSLNKLDTWSHYILTSSMEFEKLFGRRADKKRKLYNGNIMCNYYQFYGPKPKFGEIE